MSHVPIEMPKIAAAWAVADALQWRNGAAPQLGRPGARAAREECFRCNENRGPNPLRRPQPIGGCHGCLAGGR